MSSKTWEEEARHQLYWGCRECGYTMKELPAPEAEELFGRGLAWKCPNCHLMAYATPLEHGIPAMRYLAPGDYGNPMRFKIRDLEFAMMADHEGTIRIAIFKGDLGLSLHFDDDVLAVADRPMGFKGEPPRHPRIVVKKDLSTEVI